MWGNSWGAQLGNTVWGHNRRYSHGAELGGTARDMAGSANTGATPRCHPCVPSPGYRCFKATMFLSGLFFGSTVIFLLCRQEREQQLSLEASAAVTAAIGLLCGLLTTLLRAVGLFATGLLLGLLAATATLVAVPPPTLSPWVTVGTLLGLALLCALLALRWPKAVTVLATAAFGAAVMVVCADYLAEGLALVAHIAARLQLVPARALCWHGWLLLGTWPVLSVLGVLLQWRVTASGFSHHDGEGQGRTQRDTRPDGSGETGVGCGSGCRDRDGCGDGDRGVTGDEDTRTGMDVGTGMSVPKGAYGDG